MVRLAVALSNVALHVFDDDDGVVDHEAGGQRDAEQRERIDGEAENADEREGADQRNRDGDRGDKRGAPVLQEEKITAMTMTMASISVLMTSWIEAPTTVVVSKATAYFMPGGKDLERRAARLWRRDPPASALALLSCCTPKPTAGMPLKRKRAARKSPAPSSAWPTSLICTMPCGVFLTMMLLNCSGVVRRPTTLTVIWKACLESDGGAPSWPEGTSTFCCCRARRLHRSR